MKKLLLFPLFLFSAVLFTSCSSEEDNDGNDDNQSIEYILGEDNLSLYLEGKIYKYVVELYLDGDRLRIIQFGSDGNRNVTNYCGANGEWCNTDSRGSCYSTCSSYSNSSVILESPKYLEYDNGDTITLIDGSLYLNTGGSTNYELLNSSEEEIESLKSEMIYECEGNC
jgi:hypothetical protein